MKKISKKSTVDEIKTRFDNDVERFSQVETGQQTTMDASYTMELITDSIMAYSPNIKTVLDVGCGAGNYTLKLLSKKAPLNCTLLDLSLPMLQRAQERVEAVNSGTVTLVQEDIRTAVLPENSYCTIIASAVLHHLRDDADWETVFSKLYRLLKPGGSLWISDLIVQETPGIQQLLFNERYGNYLTHLKDEAFRDRVFDYIEKEDSPRSFNYQFKLLERVGFRHIELLHKNACFAAFGAIK
ncbi:class I SAM-dependent methyltransferase [Zunongwangia pacifica]|uniref:Class I SAM-dependent methyltransferase n=1 Tax=Zunongwangia pacifica TaxID=2911062 RepID=A0A9X2A2C2_9FLAO|nr:class I SAM-dependent methyltransferase [Zunongwangia pacifica]MCL6220856.1 class I SAM-dependent methyltransferase [Zunongwangia pacifica]